jgi:hypothetical protein
VNDSSTVMRIGDVIMAFSASTLVTAASCMILQSSFGATMESSLYA